MHFPGIRGFPWKLHVFLQPLSAFGSALRHRRIQADWHAGLVFSVHFHQYRSEWYSFLLPSPDTGILSVQIPDDCQEKEARRCSEVQSYLVLFLFPRFFPQTGDDPTQWHPRCSYLLPPELPEAQQADKSPHAPLPAVHHFPVKEPAVCFPAIYPESALPSHLLFPGAAVQDFLPDHRLSDHLFLWLPPEHQEECPAIPVPAFHLQPDKEPFPDGTGCSPDERSCEHTLSGFLLPEQYCIPALPCCEEADLRQKP